MASHDAVSIRRTGLVTSVGLTAPASCAAIRAKLTNPSETRFIDSNGKWITAHQVPLEAPLRGLRRLAQMAAMAIEEALQDVPMSEWNGLPLLLCVAEPERPGRADRLDDQLYQMIQAELGASFANGSGTFAQGHVGVAIALVQARSMLAAGKARQVVIAAVDSLLSWPTLNHYEQRDRLLTEKNSNGFMPGEAAGAVLVTPLSGESGELLCTGIGFGHEAAHIDSEQPLRADGLSQAISAALADAGSKMHDMNVRITDISGEQYYFKEASLALSRTMRVTKKCFDLWHPAECTGDVGAASGITILAAAKAACDKRYIPGRNILVHMANDAGQRAAMTLHLPKN
jgi:3-oxoacyl-[acyl-carrier-protein] synthase-1